jgi:hypothetical protein
MPFRPAVAMPLAAALSVFAMLVGVLLVMTGGESSEPATSPAESEPPAEAETEELRPDSSVCQSVLNRPGPDDPQVFPAVYSQQREVRGITIVASRRVSDEALDIAEATIERVFENNELIDALAEQRAYVIVADESQGVLDLPEFGCLEEELGAEFFTHVCGVADRADYPVATVNELDLTENRSGPCGGLNILFHELGHLVQGWTLDPQDYFEVRLLYQRAKDAGKYINAYASSNPNEYFAEGTQAYFLSQDREGQRDRDWLREYDPALFELLDRIYGG